MDIMGLILIEDAEGDAPVVTGERQHNCVECRHYMSGDGGPCNDCSAAWRYSGYTATPMFEAMPAEAPKKLSWFYRLFAAITAQHDLHGGSY